MPRTASLPALSLILILAATTRAQDEPEGRPKPQRYSPPSRHFYCDVPVGWQAFEEQDDNGALVHILGPENASSSYRPGFDIRFSEKGEPGFEAYKKSLDELRRSDKQTSRQATGVRVLRVSGALARVFEITENSRLPSGRWPALSSELHRYMAVYPSGESYFVISLASPRDHYLDYREIFLDFLKNFKPANQP